MQVKVSLFLLTRHNPTVILSLLICPAFHCSSETMEAWVNMFAFIMRSMLPIAIKDQTAETEFFMNTKTAFHSDNMKAQVMEAKLSSVHSSARSLGTYRSETTSTTHNSIRTNAASGRIAVTNAHAQAPFSSPLVPILSGDDLAGMV